MTVTNITPEVVSKTPQADLPTDVSDLLKFEALLVDISARLVALPPDRLDETIGDVLHAVCEFFGIDHSTLWQASRFEPEGLLTHMHRDPSLPPVPRNVSSSDLFPWASRKLLEGETLCFSRSSELPPEAAIDKQGWETYHIKSRLAFPLIFGDGPVIGCLAFCSTQRERDWPERLKERLQLVSQLFANALGRKRHELALRDSEARLALAAECADVGLWTFDPGSGRFWSTKTTNQVLGFAERDEFDWPRFLSVVHPEDRDLVNQALERALQAAETTALEYRIVRPDGTVRWMNSRGRLNRSERADPPSLMGVIVDVTERKTSEIELAKSYAETKALKERVEVESEYLQEEIKLVGRFDDIVGHSDALKKVLQQVEQVAPTNSIVLITGETGTGKELIARAIHALSKRRERVMIKVDCAALPPTLIESELFGREKGAYTGALSRQLGRFETADGSTLFIDEIGELALDLQCKLLRVVQDGEFERLGSAKTLRVDVRLVAATHRDLLERTKSGTFRDDLFYRLNVFPIRVPPLRERLEDIPLLVTAFVREFEKKMDKKIRVIPSRVMSTLQRYSWPGNIRELKSVIERGVIMASGEKLEVHLPESASPLATQSLTEAEYRHIVSVLEKTKWRVKGAGGAAALLCVKPSTLYTMMRRLKIPTRHQKGGMSA